jgi:catalase
MKESSGRAKTGTKATKATGAKNETTGNGGELHQRALEDGDGADGSVLTTNQGIPVSDDQNSLKSHPRGPTLLEDFVLREKIMHFDHERIPERIVHARGSGAHGYFELTKSLGKQTIAKVLTEKGKKVPVFVRISTVAGGAGSVDTPRDVRGFAIKFYTEEGNWDLVGNNIPVFFIQDAIKFPDLIHAVKMEPDRGFPQAASAHDTFWDFISLTPEAMHMALWTMSDRAIPRSLRMIEGFGIHTFKLVDKDGGFTFVKFHLRPKLGLQSMVWDEAVKVAGADPDYMRRDLYEAITSGQFPEWDVAVQLFTEEEAEAFPFDPLDATKLIPEELVPLTTIGRLVLDRVPDNFFAEVEQVAFCPANLPPGIDVSDDPLLQGRLFSYLDTQLSRLGSPNFHELPINRPKCPFANNQRDGHMQQQVPRGRVAYEPNSLDPHGPREVARGFRSAKATVTDATKSRLRPESFAEHYGQARMFFVSLEPEEQQHVVDAFTFELSKVETPAIRERMVAHLGNVDPSLAQRIADGLGLAKVPAPPKPPVAIPSYEPSPPLRVIGNTKDTLEGRTVAILVADGTDGKRLAKLRGSLLSAGATVKIVAPKVGGAKAANGSAIDVDAQLGGAPSVLFDGVVLLLDARAGKALAEDVRAIDFVRDAYGHLKGLAADEGGQMVIARAGLAPDAGVVDANDAAAVVAATSVRHLARESRVRPQPYGAKTPDA